MTNYAAIASMSVVALICFTWLWLRAIGIKARNPVIPFHRFVWVLIWVAPYYASRFLYCLMVFCMLGLERARDSWEATS